MSDRQIDRQTDRQTDRQADRQADRRTDTDTVRFVFHYSFLPEHLLLSDGKLKAG